MSCAELGSSQPLLLGLVAAVVGFGGYKIFTGRQGQVASKPGKAAQGVKRQVQVLSCKDMSNLHFYLPKLCFEC